jgi:hypothetical protein
VNETIIAAIIGGAAGVLPVVVTRVFGRIESRSHLRQQVQALDLAKKRVEFLQSWMGARKSCLPRETVDGSIQEAFKELDEIRSTLKRVLEKAVSQARSYQERPFLQRLLLAYRPKKVSGWWWRVAYYTWTGAIAASMLDGVLRQDFFTGRDEGGGFSAAVLVGEFIGAILLVLPSVFFHRRAVRSDSVPPNVPIAPPAVDQ